MQHQRAHTTREGVKALMQRSAAVIHKAKAVLAFPQQDYRYFPTRAIFVWLLAFTVERSSCVCVLLLCLHLTAASILNVAQALTSHVEDPFAQQTGYISTMFPDLASHNWTVQLPVARVPDEVDCFAARNQLSTHLTKRNMEHVPRHLPGDANLAPFRH
eukprot:3319822-Amphidinium_carterae.1